MDKFKKLLKDFSLFLSAFVPMFVLILVKLVIDMLNNNLSFNVFHPFAFNSKWNRRAYLEH